MPISYGKKISRKDADAAFKSFIELKDQTVITFKRALINNPRARRYFTTRQVGAKETYDVAFLFDKEFIQELLSRLGGDPGGLILFNGARDATADDVDGRPTLIAFACKYITDEDSDPAQENSTIKLQFGNDPTTAGYEHPGNDQIDFILTHQVEIPDEIDPSNVTLELLDRGDIIPKISGV